VLCGLRATLTSLVRRAARASGRIETVGHSVEVSAFQKDISRVSHNASFCAALRAASVPRWDDADVYATLRA
jgi:hypothetical protein